MRENNREKGSRYEQKVAAYLTDNGFKIIEKNYRCRLGEIDLIAMDGIYLCFVEVKYRSQTQTGHPLEAVGARKQRKIMTIAQVYLKQKGLGIDTLCRFDVAAVTGDEIIYIKNAFGSM